MVIRYNTVCWFKGLSGFTQQDFGKLGKISPWLPLNDIFSAVSLWRNVFFWELPKQHLLAHLPSQKKNSPSLRDKIILMPCPSYLTVFTTQNLSDHVITRSFKGVRASCLHFFSRDRKKCLDTCSKVHFYSFCADNFAIASLDSDQKVIIESVLWLALISYLVYLLWILQWRDEMLNL